MTTTSNLLGNNVITQLGILVHDIETTKKAYAEFFGVDNPPWSLTTGYDEAQTEYLGEASEARAKLAFFNLGSLQIELIEPDETPSVWRDYLNEHGEGLHHVALFIKGMKQKIELLGDAGIPLLQKGEYTGGRYAYVDTIRDLKMIVELLENDK